MTLRDFPEVQALSPRQKLELMDELWTSVAPDLDKLEISDDIKGALDKRWAEFLRNPSSALTLEQFKKSIPGYS
jgi:putative addiction module component (TIGR02574 family)